MSRFHFSCGLLLAVIVTSSVCSAEDLVIREVYWQQLPAYYMYFDNDGLPWFGVLEEDSMPERGPDFGKLGGHQVLLLGDRAGRLWINNRYVAGPTRYFDGKDWHNTGISARSAFEDSAGRVYLADATSVHVFDGKTWSSQRVYPEPSSSDGHFVEDSVGRVWFWATSVNRGHGEYDIGTVGVWRYASGGWTNYNSESGLTVEDVEVICPLSNDRFLVLGGLESAPSDSRPCFVWSPSQQLFSERMNFLGPWPSGRIHHRGVDLDGAHHFFVADTNSPSRDHRVVVSPQGQARVLSPAEAARAEGFANRPYENNGRIFGRMSEIAPTVPAQPGEAIGMDRRGRTYFRYNNRVGVVWPKFERTGDLIRMERPRKNVWSTFQTRNGHVWGVGSSIPPNPRGDVCLFLWDGKEWADTPVETLPHPPWHMIYGPPWSSAHPVVVSSGDSVLAVLARDIYQDVQAGARGNELRDSGRLAQRANEEAAKRGGERQWQEVWFHHEGKWSGPEKLTTFLERHWQLLAGMYQRPAMRSEWFAILGEGSERLWVVCGAEVIAIDQDGVKRFPIPPGPRPPQSYQLCRLPDGRILLSISRESGPDLLALQIHHETISAEPFAESDWGLHAYNFSAPVVFASRDQTIFLTSRKFVWELRDSRWERRSDLGNFLFEDVDGSLWFLPGEAYEFGDQRGYRIVKDGNTRTFPWSSQYDFGSLTRADDGRLLVAAGYWLVELSNAAGAMQRTIEKVSIGPIGINPVYRSDDGTIFANGLVGK